MARKKLPKDIDLTKNMNPADGFFSTPASAEKDTEDMETKNKFRRMGLNMGQLSCPSGQLMAVN